MVTFLKVRWHKFYPLIANIGMLSLFTWTEILFGGVIAKPSRDHARDCGSHNYLFGVATTLVVFRPIEFVFGTLLDTRGEPVMHSKASPIGAIDTTKHSTLARYGFRARRSLAKSSISSFSESAG